MSKGLEALEQLSKLVFVYGGVEQYRQIEKELKALEIIRKKGLNTSELWFIKNNKSWKEYTETMLEIYFGDEDLETNLKTQEEYDLLKEVLN